MSLPTRSIDDQLYYQFVEWPVHILKTRVSSNVDGKVSLESLKNSHLSSLPVIGFPIEQLPYDKHGLVSVESQIRPIYQEHLDELTRFLKSPVLGTWYESIKKLGSVHQILEEFAGDAVVYQGVEDSQQNPEWVKADLGGLKKRVQLEYFLGLGHCFAPMEGAIGHVKSSGPLDARVLDRLIQDILIALE
jgi:hypothetical protein